VRWENVSRKRTPSIIFRDTIFTRRRTLNTSPASLKLGGGSHTTLKLSIILKRLYRCKGDGRFNGLSLTIDTWFVCSHRICCTTTLISSSNCYQPPWCFDHRPSGISTTRVRTTFITIWERKTLKTISHCNRRKEYIHLAWFDASHEEKLWMMERHLSTSWPHTSRCPITDYHIGIGSGRLSLIQLPRGA
jgi:hypothetical protein